MKGAKFLMAVVLMVSMNLSVGAPGAAENPLKPEKNQIKLAVPPIGFNLLPWYVAVDNGLYEKEGLKVEFLSVNSGSEVLKLLIGKSIDVATSGLSSSSMGINAGQKLKCFYSGVNSAGWTWYAVPKIKSLREAKGATFGVSRYGSSSDNLTRYMLKSVGFDSKKDAKILQAGEQPSQLLLMGNGQLDVGNFSPPYNFIAEDRGYNLIFSLSDLMKEYAGQTFYAMEEFIKNNPNTIKTLLRGHVQAIRLIKKDRELSVKSLMKHMELEEKYARRAYDYLVPDLYEDGRLPDEKSLGTFWDISIMAGEVKEKWPREKYFDSSFTNTYSQWKP